MPALLMERGLTAAVEDLADRVPIRTILDFGGDDHDGRDERLPASVEGTAYAVIAEALDQRGQALGGIAHRGNGSSRADAPADQGGRDGVGGAGPSAARDSAG